MKSMSQHALLHQQLALERVRAVAHEHAALDDVWIDALEVIVVGDDFAHRGGAGLEARAEAVVVALAHEADVGALHRARRCRRGERRAGERRETGCQPGPKSLRTPHVPLRTSGAS
jgi:hypothetical protein